MMNSAVLAHTFGLEVSSSSTIETYHCPFIGDADGCSSKPSGGIIQDTLGSVPALTSAAKSLGNVGVNAFLYSDEFGCRNAVKYGRTLSVSSRLVVINGSYRAGPQVRYLLSDAYLPLTPTLLGE